MGTTDRRTFAAVRPRHRLTRGVAAVTLTLGLTAGLSGCGFDVQTLQPYTPEAGVNTDVSTEQGVGPTTVVRNLLVISRADGEGFLSAGLSVERPDELVDVTGVAIGPDGQRGAPLQVTLGGDYVLEPAEGLVVLTTDRPVITVSGEGIVAGLTAELTLTFREGGTTTLAVPIVDGLAEDYATVTPAPAPTPSASPSPSSTP